MSNRKGMMIGKGSGYKNVVGRDPAVHSQSAQGIKQPQHVNIIPSISKKEWNETPKDYKSIIKGTPYQLRMENGSTVLTPVNIVEKKSFKSGNQIVKLELNIKEKEGTDYETFQKENFAVVSISGDLKELSESGRGRPRDSSWGQIYDSINTEGNPKLKRIVELWKKNHLNDLTAGTKRQEQALKEWKNRPEGFSYDKDVAYLKSKGLYVDKGYQYGTQWLVRPVPKEDINELIELFK